LAKVILQGTALALQRASDLKTPASRSHGEGQLRGEIKLSTIVGGSTGKEKRGGTIQILTIFVKQGNFPKFGAIRLWGGKKGKKPKSPPSVGHSICRLKISNFKFEAH